MAVPLLKICGLKDSAQAAAVAAMGVDAVGVIGVESSPRHVPASQRRRIFRAVAGCRPRCRRVLVVADPEDRLIEDLKALPPHDRPDVLQLHGDETPDRCRRLQEAFPGSLWKAFRIRRPEDLDCIGPYRAVVDALLLDAWAPDQLGGTGRRLPVEWLEGFEPPCPWWLAGGLSAAVLPEVLSVLHPTGVDVSSGVETAPGVKDLARVRELTDLLRIRS